jgi:transposase
VKLRPVDLESLLSPDHEVRSVWQFVSSLDLSRFEAQIKAVDGRAGRPATDPRLLLSLWLYAITKGIGSARELARLTT